MSLFFCSALAFLISFSLRGQVPPSWSFSQCLGDHSRQVQRNISPSSHTAEYPACSQSLQGSGHHVFSIVPAIREPEPRHRDSQQSIPEQHNGRSYAEVLPQSSGEHCKHAVCTCFFFLAPADQAGTIFAWPFLCNPLPMRPSVQPPFISVQRATFPPTYSNRHE